MTIQELETRLDQLSQDDKGHIFQRLALISCAVAGNPAEIEQAIEVQAAL